jgi:type IV secretory pathway VirB3-like protein
MSDPNALRAAWEDTLHVGATRPVRFLGLPMPLAIALGGLAYFIQTNVTGWQGIIWAASIVGPLWFIAYLAVAHDPYGINVVLAWLRTSVLAFDKRQWGTHSPPPVRLEAGWRHGAGFYEPLPADW